jgi:hypothetical protein
MLSILCEIFYIFLLIDTFSVNSYMLEQEYMNNDEQIKQSVNSQEKPLGNDTQTEQTG